MMPLLRRLNSPLAGLLLCSTFLLSTACDRAATSSPPASAEASRPAESTAITPREKDSATDAPHQEDVASAQPMPEGWRAVATEELNDSQQAQLQKARDARDTLASTLMGRVLSVVKEQGAPAAVEVCHSEASELTAGVGEQHGVTIGRSSDKLRNPDNQAPPWATSLVNPQGTPGLAVGPGEQLGMLAPIRIARPCLTCHGERESLAPDIARKLEDYYPRDQATGYAEGDLRGWFWVEVPPLDS
ncbi:hypothetical protein DL240_13915 [Lujinxingia litoralis]|uniref:Tll0287-like domain-containing protein n=1 Tax=Lujinxingia litoralis TaxID=2211119 RepID=A0A328C4A7_9DELT|nr:DUF3365 domain-containing protein [Lujinxingia litoralis]RAL21224.1 hypothetical protein DL240_13915 [Lujinxingia litoralis]